MQWFGGDPGVPVVRDGVETFPLVPVAVGLYSIGFNIFNTALMFPFVGVFARVLSRVGHSDADDAEDFSVPRFLNPGEANVSTRLPLVQQEMGRHVSAAGLFLEIAQRKKRTRGESKEHHAALDILSREIRRYTAAMLRPDTSPREADLVASLIEEQDFTGSLAETLFQVARRVEREAFCPRGQEFVDAVLEQVAHAIRTISPKSHALSLVDPEERRQFLLATRQRLLEADGDLPWAERGRVLELLGSAERAFLLIDRIDAERKSVPRVVPVPSEAPASALRSTGLAPVVP